MIDPTKDWLKVNWTKGEAFWAIERAKKSQTSAEAVLAKILVSVALVIPESDDGTVGGLLTKYISKWDGTREAYFLRSDFPLQDSRYVLVGLEKDAHRYVIFGWGTGREIRSQSMLWNEHQIKLNLVQLNPIWELFTTVHRERMKRGHNPLPAKFR